MAQLQQVQIQYSAADDRLLLRISSDTGAEYRVWLTRRIVRAMWPKLVESLRRAPEISSQSHPEAREAILSIKHDEAVAKADYGTRYQERGDRTFPLGQEPLLAAKVRLQPAPAGHVLALHPQRGQGIDLTLSESLMHAFCKLLADTTAKAEWDLDLRVAGDVAEATEAPRVH